MYDLRKFIQEIHKNQYKDEVELELKLLSDKYSKEEFKSLFNIINTKYNLEERQYVNFISKDGTNKQFEFKEGIKINDSKLIYLKTPIKSQYINWKNISWKLKACREHILSINNDNNIQYNLIRFKRRFSTLLSPEWRMDYTFIISIPYNSPETILRSAKEKIFLTDLLIIFDVIDCVELEIEYIQSIDTLTQDSIETILDVFSNITEKPVIELYDYHINKLKHIFSDKISKHNNRRLSIKQLLPQTLSLSKKEYFNILYNGKISEFYISHKLDGERVLLFIDKENSGYLTTTKWHKLDIKADWSAILDCELYFINESYIFYVFDVIEYTYLEITYPMYTCPFILRKKCMDNLNLDNINIKLDNFKIKIKPCFQLTDNYSEILNQLNEQKTEFPTDGIIFTSSRENYQNTQYFKWKPTKYMTIEFIAKECPSNILGIPPYSKQRGKTLYLLYVGIRSDMMHSMSLNRLQHYYSIFTTLNRKDYIPIHFSPSNSPLAYLFWNENPSLDNKIVELVWENEWKLLKIRDDRQTDYENNQYFGNDFMVAELIWNSYSNPFTFEQLILPYNDMKNQFYFITDNSKKYQGIRYFNNWVKNKLLESIGQNQYWLVDLGSGKGQDFLKYIKLGVRNIIFIDENPNNIEEIISRKYLYLKQGHFNKKSLGIYTICQDITKQNVIEKINQFKLNCKLIVCNFAIHYMCYNKDTLLNYAKIISSILESTGRLLITYLNGKYIFDKFIISKSNNWICGKYHFKKLFIANTYTGTNQKISVKLPFSEGFYEEYLFNIDLLIKELKKYKIIVETKGGFNEFIDMYQQHNKSNLEKDDIEYISSLEYIIFYRN
jgi:hypothetical protein